MSRARSLPMLAFALAFAPAAALAQTPSAESPGEADDDGLAEMREELRVQRALIEEQGRQLAAQNAEIAKLKGWLDPAELAILAGRGAMQAPTGQPSVLSGPQLPDQPVGEAPPEPEAQVRARVEAIPQEQGVLTPPGRLVVDPSFEYTRSSSNRLVFRGIELVPGIQIGLIEATDADRDTLAATLALRYGLTSRLEIEARVPFLYRQDRIEVVQQRDEGIVRQIGLREEDIGDVEFAMRYQINRPRGQRPIWVANLRVKSDTGLSPFEVDFDEFGVATGLATGSGFWAVQPGVSFLLPSDPVVIFGSASYLYHIPRDIDRNIGGAFIGRVDPGDAVSAGLGFGFALNPRFSFSLGYRHSYIFKTVSEIGDTIQRSNSLQVGSLTFGMSYRLTETQTFNVGFEFGMTSDSPDVGITFRLPIAFDLQ